MKTIDPSDALRELRGLVGSYLEGSADAARATELLDALQAVAPRREATTVRDETASARWKREERERKMFGCTAAAIDQVIDGKPARDVAIYAMGTLSNAQELFTRREVDGAAEWSVADRHADTIRQLMNVAKYAVDKAVPR